VLPSAWSLFHRAVLVISRGLLAVCLAGAASWSALAAAAEVPGSTPARRWSHLTEIAFQHLTQDDGLPNEIATAVAEDGEGFLWIGTLGGLARWDGYRFRVYKADPHAPGALPDNFIQTLHGDANGTLWVGTSSAGIVRYDAATDRFVSYPVGDRGLSHVSVRSIVDDGGGGLWVATDGGLDHLDPASGSIVHATAGGAGWAGLAGVRAHVVLRDALGALWVGSSAGLFRREPNGEQFTSVRLPTGQGAQPEPLTLAEDSAGRLWVGTLQHGAFVLEDHGRGAAKVIHETTPPDGVDMLRDRQIVTLAEVQPGEMWIGMVGQGIVSVDLARGQSHRIRNVPTWSMSLPDNALRDLHRDRSGLVWVATNRGVSRHDPRQSAILTRFGVAPTDTSLATRASTEVSWILAMPQGRLWLGTHKSGVEILDGTGARVGALRPDAARPETALPQDIVLGMERAPDGGVFIGTKRGLYLASADGSRVSRVTLPGRDPAASTWALLADGDTLWVGGQTDGLWKFDLRHRTATPVLRGATPGLSDQRIVVLAKGANGSLWVGTRYGLNQVDPATGEVKRYLPDPSSPRGLSAGFITALLPDAQGRLWIGTYGGGIDVLPLHDQAARVKHLGTAQGLPDGNVNALLEDLQGRLWASTDNGLAIIQPDSLAVRALRRAEGVVLPTYWTGSAARTAEGELLFGGAGGMTIVRPEQLQSWSYHPAVVVTDLKVGGRSVPAARFTVADGATAASMSNTLIVPPEANSLAVEFSAIDYSAPERNRYAYKLEGFDADWVDTDPSRRLAAYTNLPPGSYRLMLRGSNRDGTWSERVVGLPIRVRPDWHQTLWFRLGVALALFMLLVVVVQLRTRLLRARHVELERKVRERTAELEALHKALKDKSLVLERTSITDPLTGLHNRRFLTDHIEQDIAASLRRSQESRAGGGVPIDTDSVFFLLDVDHFKRVNDVYGHAVGDAVLVQVSRRLRSVMRESDYLVRWGGEEFLAVARDTDRARAEELAERMRTVIAETPFLVEGGRLLPVTCSIGFACLPYLPWRPHALGWQDVVRLADLALYASKRAGRDAWVGLHATEQAHAESLLATVYGGPEKALQEGEIRTTSNKPLDVVAQALAPQTGDSTPWPFSAAPAPTST
jgi:diguanylate cyclase (GGDEF)-like protein